MSTTNGNEDLLDDASTQHLQDEEEDCGQPDNTRATVKSDNNTNPAAKARGTEKAATGEKTKKHAKAKGKSEEGDSAATTTTSDAAAKKTSKKTAAKKDENAKGEPDDDAELKKKPVKIDDRVVEMDANFKDVCARNRACAAKNDFSPRIPKLTPGKYPMVYPRLYESDVKVVQAAKVHDVHALECVAWRMPNGAVVSAFRGDHILVPKQGGAAPILGCVDELISDRHCKFPQLRVINHVVCADTKNNGRLPWVYVAENDWTELTITKDFAFQRVDVVFVKRGEEGEQPLPTDNRCVVYSDALSIATFDKKPVAGKARKVTEHTLCDVDDESRNVVWTENHFSEPWPEYLFPHEQKKSDEVHHHHHEKKHASSPKRSASEQTKKTKQNKTDTPTKKKTKKNAEDGAKPAKGIAVEKTPKNKTSNHEDEIEPDKTNDTEVAPPVAKKQKVEEVDRSTSTERVALATHDMGAMLRATKAYARNMRALVQEDPIAVRHMREIESVINNLPYV